jgi:uncharacterized protein with FMN-binding domain
VRRIAVALMSTISGLVLLFSYHTSLGPGSPAGGDPGTGPAGDATGLVANGQVLAGAGSAAGAAGGAGAAAPDGRRAQHGRGVSGTFTGAKVPTHWGLVQVQILIKNGKITAARAIQYPSATRHSQELSSRAIPRLENATVRTGSARIDSVSGATGTSQGYIASLQSALDTSHR